jgi:hypothetical protein
MQGVNRGKEEVDTIRGVPDEQGGFELTTPVVYSMPYISPENRGRLLQAELRNRSEIQGHFESSGTPIDTRTPFERCRDSMKKRLRSSRSESLDKYVPNEGSRMVQSSGTSPDGALTEIRPVKSALDTRTPGSPEATSDMPTPFERCRDSIKKRLSLRPEFPDEDGLKERLKVAQTSVSPDGPLTGNSSVEGALNRGTHR